MCRLKIIDKIVELMFHLPVASRSATATGFSNAQTQVNGQNTGGFGYINLATAGTQAGQPRNGTLVARFTF